MADGQQQHQQQQGGSARGVRLPGLETLFGIRSEDPLSSLAYLASNELARSNSVPSPRASYASGSPSIASSSRSDPSAFSLIHDGASIRSYATSSSEMGDDTMSVDEPPWASFEGASNPSSPSRARSSKHHRHHQGPRGVTTVPSISALRTSANEMAPPLAPPRSSSLKKRPSGGVSPLPSPLALQGGFYDESRSRRGSISSLEHPFSHRPDSSPLNGELFLPPPQPRPDTSGSDTASLRSVGQQSQYSDRSSLHDPYRPSYFHGGRPSRDFASFSSGSSPRSSISTTATSYRPYEESFEGLSISSPGAPPSVLGVRPRASMDEIPPERRPVHQPLAGMLQSVSESPMRFVPDQPAYKPPPPAPSAASSISSTHSNMRYSCPHCQKRFSRPSSLRIHVFSHTGEKPYACEVCGRAFSVQSNLKRHMRTHANATATPSAGAEQVEEGDADSDGEGEPDGSAMET